MSRKVLSKEEFVRRVMADFAAAKSVVATPVRAEHKKPKRRCSYRRKKYSDFDVIERTVLYA